MKPEDITLDLHTSTIYATAYVGDQPIASVARRPYRVTGGPAWTATGVFGEENGQPIARVYGDSNMDEAFVERHLKIRLAHHYSKPATIARIGKELRAPKCELCGAPSVSEEGFILCSACGNKNDVS